MAATTLPIHNNKTTSLHTGENGLFYIKNKHD